MPSRPEKEFLDLLVLHGIPREDIKLEYEFFPRRKWRSDFYVPKANLLLEMEGGVFGHTPSRHTNPRGYAQDCDKYNTASALGFRLLRTTTDGEQMQRTARLAATLYKRK